MNTTGPGPRAALRAAVATFVGAAGVVAAVTWGVSGEVSAAWVSLTIGGFGLGEAVYDNFKAGQT